jgi:molybdopterin molybdotransferase
MLSAMLGTLGFPPADLGIVVDEPGALDEAIARGMTYDVLLVSGGVSVGAYDLVASTLTRAGCEVLFHTVAMRPGKPLLAAKRGRTLILGLPGNPVSAFTSFQVFAAPALRRLAGDPEPVVRPVRAALTQHLSRRPGRMTYHLARFSTVDRRPVVTPTPSRSSGDVLSLAAANAFIVAEGSETAIAAGTDVDVQPWA